MHRLPSSLVLKALRAADREYSGPRRAARSCSDTGLPRPSTTYDAVPMEPGMSPGSPVLGLDRPLAGHPDLLAEVRLLLG